MSRTAIRQNCRYLERHPRLTELLSDRPQLRFATRHLGSLGGALLGSLGLSLQPSLRATVRNRGHCGFSTSTAESCDRSPSAHRSGPLVSRNSLVRSGASYHIDSGVQAIRHRHDTCRSHSGIPLNSCSIPSPASRSAHPRRKHPLRRAVASRRY